MINPGKIDIIEDDKKEEIKNDIKEEIKEKEDDIINNNVKIEEKIVSEEIPNKIDNLNKNKTFDEYREITYFEEKINIVKNNLFVNDVNNIYDILNLLLFL